MKGMDDNRAQSVGCIEIYSMMLDLSDVAPNLLTPQSVQMELLSQALFTTFLWFGRKYGVRRVCPKLFLLSSIGSILLEQHTDIQGLQQP